MKKREFLTQMGLLGLSMPLGYASVEKWAETIQTVPIDRLSEEDSFWEGIRKSYKLKPDYINLENGYYCMLPEPVLEAYLELVKMVNYHASWYMRTVQWENKDTSVAALAKLAGCASDELIITRNTTESLDMVISGMHWEKGDEAVMAWQDYGSMLDQFKMMEKRYGIKNTVVSIPNHPTSDEEIVRLYEQAITDKTKLLMVCHMVNITGQILPVRKICDMAHQRGVQVMVDGAHAFAHIEVDMKDLNCDYYGTSLHKWLGVPLGAGFLYVAKKQQQNIWPLFAEHESLEGSIKRLNHTGTHPVHTDLAILNAIDFHQMVGIQRKQARLKYLQNYWTSQVRGLDRVTVNTPAEMDRHGAIGNVGVEGIAPRDLAKRMLDEFKIWTVAIDRPGVQGLRITPHLYTRTQDLDVLVEAIKKIANA